MRRNNPNPKVSKSVAPLEESIPKATLGFNDFESFCAGVKIISEGGIKTFQLFAFQLELAKLILSGNYRVIYILKSRQLGISLLIGVILAYKAISQSGFAAFVISLGQGESSKFGTRVKRAFNSWGIKLSNDNTRQHSLDNESTIDYYPNTSTGSRGDSSSYSIYDECAFYNLRFLKGSSAASKIWAGEGNSVSISLSTPSSKSSEFYELMSEGNSEPIELIAEKIVSGDYPPFYHFTDERAALKVLIHFTAIEKFKRDPNLYYDLLIEEGLTPEQIDREANLKFDDNFGASFNYAKVNNLFSLDEWVSYQQLKLAGYDIVIGIDPSGYGSDQTAVIIIAVHTRLYNIKILKEFYLDEPDYDEVESFLLKELQKNKATLFIELNGVGVGAYQYFNKYSDIGRLHKIVDYTATENTKIETLAFLKWLIDKDIIEGFEDLKILKHQLKNYDLNEMKGIGNEKDDGVSALMHCLQFCQFEKWYRAKKGLGTTTQMGTSHLVGGVKIKSINSFNSSSNYS